MFIHTATLIYKITYHHLTSEKLNRAQIFLNEINTWVKKYLNGWEHAKNQVTNVFPLKRFKTPISFFVFSTFEMNLFGSYEQTICTSTGSGSRSGPSNTGQLRAPLWPERGAHVRAAAAGTPFGRWRKLIQETCRSTLITIMKIQWVQVFNYSCSFFHCRWFLLFCPG